MKKTLKIFLSVCLVALFLLILVFYFNRKQTLTIHTNNGEIQYRVESALTPTEQQKGLMYRKHLASRNGMIFIFNPPRVARMWMKNTLIPLDMVFFDRMGRVIRVHKNAVPHDETVISSIVPVLGVLEVNAGETEKFGITHGSTLDLTPLK